MKNYLIFIIVLLFFSNCNSPENNTEKNFIKGVYGDPGTLLEAGYNFDELGMNAIFVRSYSLDDELYSAAREQGCKIFVEFPVLLGRQFLENNPQCWPIEKTGEQSPPADWFMGICPTCPEFKEDRGQHLISILKRFEVDGVFRKVPEKTGPPGKRAEQVVPEALDQRHVAIAAPKIEKNTGMQQGLRFRGMNPLFKFGLPFGQGQTPFGILGHDPALTESVTGAVQTTADSLSEFEEIGLDRRHFRSGNILENNCVVLVGLQSLLFTALASQNHKNESRRRRIALRQGDADHFIQDGI